MVAPWGLQSRTSVCAVSADGIRDVLCRASDGSFDVSTGKSADDGVGRGSLLLADFLEHGMLCGGQLCRDRPQMLLVPPQLTAILDFTHCIVSPLYNKM